MDLLIGIWLRFGLVVYWIAWIGSVALGIASIGQGVVAGIIAWVIWAIILLLLRYIKDNWFYD